MKRPYERVKRVRGSRRKTRLHSLGNRRRPPGGCGIPLGPQGEEGCDDYGPCHVRRWNSWSKGMDEGEEGFANNLAELDACLWLVRAKVGSDKRRGWRGGPARGPGLQGPCQILLKCSHMPDTVHGTQKGSVTKFLDEGLMSDPDSLV